MGEIPHTEHGFYLISLSLKKGHDLIRGFNLCKVTEGPSKIVVYVLYRIGILGFEFRFRP